MSPLINRIRQTRLHHFFTNLVKLQRNRGIKRVSATQEAKVFIIYLVLITLAEAITAQSLSRPEYATMGLLLHTGLLLAMLLLAVFKYEANSVSNLFLSLSLAPLIRVISLILPMMTEQGRPTLPLYAWFLLSGVPILVAALVLMRVQGLRLRDVGLSVKQPLVQGGLALTGLPFGVIEYYILQPEPLVEGLSLAGYLMVAMGLIVSTGLVEELVFRGIMQRWSLKVMGTGGMIGVAVVFAVLHIGWQAPLDVFFVFVIGAFFGYASMKTQSIVGTSLSHGITNVLLFLVMPFVA